MKPTAMGQMDTYFLVCVNFALVAKDICATLEQKGMGVPLVAASPVEALSHLHSLNSADRLRLAVVQMPPAQYVLSPLRAGLAARQVPVILLDDAAHDSLPDMVTTILTLPFFTEDLERVLTELSRQSQ